MTSLTLEDPWVAAQIEAAVAPYVGRLPAADVEWMRRQLAEVLTHDPAAMRLLRRAHPREVDESEDRVIGAPAGARGPGGSSKAG